MDHFKRRKHVYCAENPRAPAQNVLEMGNGDTAEDTEVIHFEPSAFRVP